MCLAVLGLLVAVWIVLLCAMALSLAWLMQIVEVVFVQVVSVPVCRLQTVRLRPVLGIQTVRTAAVPALVALVAVRAPAILSAVMVPAMWLRLKVIMILLILLKMPVKR